MLSITDLKTGVFFVYREEPYQVLAHQHVKMGRGGAVLRTKMRNLKTGSVLEETFKGNDIFEEADLAKRPAQFLFASNQVVTFMDMTTYEQFELSEAMLGDQKNYLTEGGTVEVLLFEDKPIGVTLPIKIELRVAETAPGFKGDTAARSYKPATLASGATIQVPFHIKPGDTVVVDTRDGSYVGKA